MVRISTRAVYGQSGYANSANQPVMAIALAMLNAVERTFIVRSMRRRKAKSAYFAAPGGALKSLPSCTICAMNNRNGFSPTSLKPPCTISRRFSITALVTIMVGSIPGY